MDYYSITKKSSLDLIKWPKLFLPNIAYFLIQLISTTLLLVSPAIKGLSDFKNLEQSIRDEIARQLTGQTLLQVAASFIIFALFSFFLSVGVEALKFNMMAQAVTENKCSLRKAWKERLKNYIKLGLLKLLIYIMLIAMAAIVASPLITFEASKFKYFGLLVAIFAALLIRIAIIFSFSYMFLKKEGPMHAFGNSILHLIRHPLHSIGSWAVLTGFEIISAILGLTMYYLIGGAMGTFMVSILYILYKVWSEMFLFESLNAFRQ